MVEEMLPKVVFPESFQLPLSPDIVATGVDAKRCRVMKSKKLPLWLDFILPPPPPGAAPKGKRQQHVSVSVLACIRVGIGLTDSAFVCRCCSRWGMTCGRTNLRCKCCTL